MSDEVLNQIPPSNDNGKLLEYFCALNKVERNIDDCPEGLIIDNSVKQKLLLIINDERKLNKILNTFPFPNYRLIGYIIKDDVHSYCDTTAPESLYSLADKILVVGNNDDIIGIPIEKIITYESITLEDGEKTLLFHFGKLNKNVTILVIKPSVSNGLVWHFRNVWGKVEKYPNYKSYVDMQNFINQLSSPSHLGLYNPWNYFFKQPIDADIREIYESENVIIASYLSSMSKEMGRDKLSDLMINEEKKLAEELFGDKTRILGVFLRGTDYYYAQWHYIPYDQYEAIETVKNYMDNYNLKYIFLNTEDQINYEAFKKAFKNKLIAIDRERFQRMKILPHAQGKNKNFDGLIVGRNYILETLLTSRTDGVLSSSGMSSLLIKAWGKEYNTFFDMKLKKNLRGICGSTPIIIENHNKNYANVLLKQIDNYQITTDDDLICIAGNFLNNDVINFTDYCPTLLEACTEYSTKLITKQESLFEIYMELYHNKNKIETKKLNDRIKEKSIVNNIRYYIKIKQNFSGIIKFGIDIEKGHFVTKYENAHYSEIELPLKDLYGVYYNQKYLNWINLKTGIMNIGGNKVPYNSDELDRINNSVQFERGYSLIKLGQTYFDSPNEINDSREELEKCIDYWPIELSEKGLSKNYLAQSLVAYLNSPYDEAQKKALEKSIVLSDTLHLYEQIGRAFKEGKGTNLNLNEAAKWLRKAVNTDNKGASELFDVLWMIDTEESLKEMVKIGVEKANKNDRACMIRMGRAYRDGKGVEKDLNKAAEWMRKTTAVDYTWAAELADVLEQINSTESKEELVNLLKNASENGNSACMVRLGRAYRDGRLVEFNNEKALYWFRKAVDKDNVGATELFDLLWSINTKESLEEMIRIGMTASNKNDRACMVRIGRAYRFGKGVDRDLNKAAEWMRKTTAVDYTWAAELADVLGQIGTPDSKKEMYILLENASNSGNQACKERLQRLSSGERRGCKHENNDNRFHRIHRIIIGRSTNKR